MDIVNEVLQNLGLAMKLEDLQRLAAKEEAAKKYLLNRRWKNYRRVCQRCRSRSLLRMRTGKYRCRRCGYEFSDFSDTWLGKLRIPFQQWLLLLKLFELDVSARQASSELDLSYPTVVKGYSIIRAAILSASSGDAIMKAMPVFGVIEEADSVRVSDLPDLSAKEVMAMGIRKVRKGNVVYTDRYGDYDALVFSGSLSGRTTYRRFTRDKLWIDTLDAFWPFAKKRLSRLHGVSPAKFPLYLKETEFRYNHKGEGFYDLLVDLVARTVSPVEDLL